MTAVTEVAHICGKEVVDAIGLLQQERPNNPVVSELAKQLNGCRSLDVLKATVAASLEMSGKELDDALTNAVVEPAGMILEEDVFAAALTLQGNEN